MLDNVQRCHQIKGPVRVRQLFRFSEVDSFKAPLATKGKSVGRHVDAFRLTEFVQQLEVCARTTTNIQYSWFVTEVRADALEKAGYDATATSKPPVTTLDLIHYRVGVLLHLLRQRLIGNVCGGGHGFVSPNSASDEHGCARKKSSLMFFAGPCHLWPNLPIHSRTNPAKRLNSDLGTI